MVTPELVNWVKEQLSKGIDRQIVIENLLKSGHTKENIDLIFSSLSLSSVDQQNSINTENPLSNNQPVMSKPAFSKKSIGKTILKIFLLLILFGLLPIIINFLDRFLFISYIPVFYLISSVILFISYFSITLIISKKLGNVHPIIVILISIMSVIIVFLSNIFFCSMAMLIPCEQSSLFTPLAILFTIDVNVILFLGYLFGLMFIKSRKDKGYSLKIPSTFLIIVSIAIFAIFYIPNIRSYFSQELNKKISGYQKIPNSQLVKKNATIQNQNKIPFKQSLDLALTVAREYDSEVKTSLVELAMKGEYDYFAESGLTKVAPIPEKDVLVFHTSDKNFVTVVIDGDSGQIKDSYKISYHDRENGIDDFSDFNYGPVEALNLIKNTEEYKKYNEKVPNVEGFVVWFKPTEKPYYWEIWTNSRVNNDLYEVRFFVSTQDLSIQKVDLDLGDN